MSGEDPLATWRAVSVATLTEQALARPTSIAGIGVSSSHPCPRLVEQDGEQTDRISTTPTKPLRRIGPAGCAAG
jgi:hypothetical protein